MGALADYLDLRFAVADHTGNRAVSDLMPRFVLMAEDMLNRKLRVRQQITSTTLTFTNGVATLPDDFIEIINVFGVNGEQLRSGPLSNVQREGSQYYRYAINGTQILIRGFSGTRNIDYYAKVPSLTLEYLVDETGAYLVDENGSYIITGSLTTTNWLLDEAPDVYLYAVALEAVKFLKDIELGTATKALLDGALRAIQVDDERARWSNTTTRVQGVCP